MNDALSYVAGAVVSLLPPRYRPEVDCGAAVASGLIEAILALVVMIARAVVWTQAKTDFDLRNGALLAASSIPGSGIFLLAEFWMNPLHSFSSTS
jgi:hypothetical protein